MGMTKLNENHKSQSKVKSLKPKTVSSVHQDIDNTDCELHIDASLLIKRVNALVAHVSNLDGADEAEKNSRETSAHIKNIKEIIALNESIKHAQSETQKSLGYTPEEEQALAEELARLIINNGGVT